MSSIFSGPIEQQIETLTKIVVGLYPPGVRTTVANIEEKVMALAPLAPDLDVSALKIIVAKVETLVHIKFEDEDGGVVDPNTFVPWLTQERRSQIDWARWMAYESLLATKNLSPLVLDRMGTRADHVLELAGDPQKQGQWARRGLVIGDVQSGKTANYLAIFNKAADAGYKIIILFGGHTDKLRRQTQERVDEGFVGRDSKAISAKRPGDFKKATIGVGHHVGFRPATSLTTWATDFSTQQLKGINLDAEAVNGPVIFVIKKNKKIIENLITWLEGQGDGGGDGKLRLPMLLLDDEADYASINTNDEDKDPTAINKAIRDLMAVFARNSYVGFTATPFANVFIDPEHEQDLFPRDYVLTLESPSNYFGPEAMFEHTEGSEAFLVGNDDASAWLPYPHKGNANVGPLPASLLDSVAAFFVANAIRDLRDQHSAPRTMMINVSRFNNVQAQVFEQVSEIVSDWRRKLRQGVGEEVLARLERVFIDNYSHAGTSWEQLRMVLDSSIETVVVKLVNSKTTNSDDWDVTYRSDRARVIAVGGDVLSRGLTLEGLVISYFRRKSVAYDTLMQMGRWFGYREGYRDLCKLWIDPEVASWYDFIALATTELRDQISRMRALGQTPKQFGLAVRRHPSSALVATALNKRRTASVARQISLRDKSFETVRFSDKREVNLSNLNATRDLVTELQATRKSETSRTGNHWWQDVDANVVVRYLENFQTATQDLLFSDQIIAKHVRETRFPWMKTWDIVIASGQSNLKAFPGLIETQKVSRAIYERDGVLYSGGSKLRLGGRSDEGQVLDDDAYSRAVEAAKGKGPGDLHFRAQLTRPLMIIYPIDPAVDDQMALSIANPSTSFTRFNPAEAEYPLVGLHIALPFGDSSIPFEDDSDLVSWLVNLTWLENNNLLTEEEE